MNKIKEFRLKNKMTQEALAKALNITQACIAQWENDVSLPTSDKLPTIAKILNCRFL